MTGKQVRDKIKARGYTLRRLADEMGRSAQYVTSMLSVRDIKSGYLEQIAEVMGVSVSYFYNEQPIISVVDYAEYEKMKSEVLHLRQLLAEKERTIDILLSGAEQR